MAFTDFLFNGQPPPVVDTTTNQQSQMPLWYSQYIASLANNASQIASTPYQAFPGPQVAGFTPTQQQAQQYVQNNATAWQPAMQSAMQSSQRGAAPFSGDQLNQFMSPYIGNVVNEIGRLGQQNLTETALPTLQSQFIGSGGFGGKIDQDTTARLIRDTNANILGQQGAALQGGFQNAMTNYGQWQDRALQGGQNLSGLAQAQQGLDVGTAGALDTVGQQQQQLQQQNLNVAQQNYQNELNYPYQQANFLSSILTGKAMPQNNVTTQSQPFNGQMSPSPLAQLAGTLGMVFGATQKT